jgi:glycosyltransferase involved in cell wall biosynthesis
MTQLKALVTEQSLSQQVLFVAGTDQPEAYFSVADFFVMSSRYEPLGQTVLEALASGLPVVAFKNTGDIVTAPQELLGEQGALYAQSADPASLAVAMDAAVATMHTEDYTKSCEQNRLLAENKFAWQTLCDDLLVAQHHD